MPKVSICVPNLNTRPFLEERFETIFKQTFQDWELIVVDNYSEDGAWEFLQEQASREKRMCLSQAPREGLYANWNNCIRQARGEYVYIATSDDTMAPDCLEKLVAALDAHPECEMAHCSLKEIDEQGRDIGDWWFTSSTFANSAPDMLRRRHIRRAPLDGVLHMGAKSVYISITQLLIRRTLFERVGGFESRWGSIGDFNWNMRAALVASTVHVPDTWGGWRTHSGQATAKVDENTTEHRRLKEEMIENAMQRSLALLPKAIQGQWWQSLRKHLRQREELKRCLRTRKSRVARTAKLLVECAKGSPIALQYAGWRVRRNPFWCEQSPMTIRRWLGKAGLDNLLVPLE